MKCIICGRELSNPVSVARGIGPVCYSHHMTELRYLSSRVEAITIIRGSISFGYFLERDYGYILQSCRTSIRVSGVVQSENEKNP